MTEFLKSLAVLAVACTLVCAAQWAVLAWKNRRE